jgi:hypothetical protein
VVTKTAWLPFKTLVLEGKSAEETTTFQKFLNREVNPYKRPKRRHP